MLFKVTAIWVLTGLVLGLVSILLFNYWAHSLNIGTAYLWGLAYFVLGGLAGFIFGVPKIVANNSASTTSLKDISALPASNEKNASKNIIQENTNLTQISDWLTKVIIGAGLVELKQIPPFIVETAKKMARGISAGVLKPENVDSLVVLSGAIIVYFLVWGFVSGYLVMRLVITELLSDL
jgi:hypothetical protein